MLVSLQYLVAAVRARARGQRGASLVEYALLVALILLVCVIAISLLGRSVSSKFSSTGTSLTD